MAKNALMRPVRPDHILIELVGTEKPLPRTQIVKKVWEYIKKRELQDPNDGRIIIADNRLRELFNGKESVNMLDLAGYISDHIIDR